MKLRFCVIAAFVLSYAVAAPAKSEVADAAQHGDKAAVRSLVQKRADVNAPQIDGTTALHWAVQANDLELVDSQIQPGNNTAKINAQWRKSYGFENLRFIFLWQNPKDSWVIVSVASNLMLNGECDEFEEGGYLSGSVSNLNVDARLNVLEWWNQPPTSPFPQATQAQHVLTLSASGGGVLSNLGGGTVESATVAGTFDLSRSVFLIPPNGVAVFEVTLAFVYDNSDGGMVQVNFASSGFQVMCPSLVIGILS